MKIEIITIGDELLIGQVIDTNSAWMGQELTREGFEIKAISSVGDKEDDIINALDIAFGRADVVLLTGGVGPTKDDITKNTLCRYFHTSLVFNDEVLANILQLFRQRDIQLNELTRNQAYVPEACKVIQNKAGTAPILWFQKDEQVLVSMPGVPFEMKTAMTNDILPRLRSLYQPIHYLRRSFTVSGITESKLAMLLNDFEETLPSGFSLAYLPSFGVIRLRLSAWGDRYASEMSLQAHKLEGLLGALLIGESEKALEGLLGEKLRQRHLSISTAESCTGGHIAHRITLIPGASEYYKGSIVSYSNAVKEDLLKVSPTLLQTQGAVSREVAEQMARNVADRLKTDCSIAVSGIAGPDGGSEEKPVGTVWVCTFYHGETEAQCYHLGGNREEIILRTTQVALMQMTRMIG